MEDFDWEGDMPLEKKARELIIYEMHVRSFTAHPNSGVKHPGTFAGLAEKMVFGGPGEESPRAVGRFVCGNILTVLLSADVRTGDGEAPRLLEIAGEDGRFVPAEGEVAEGTIRIRSAEVDHPAFARYAWTDWSDQVNLFGENGLPLEPFLM